MKVKLVMFTQKGERREFKVRHDKAVIGRNKECNIQIGLEVVSRQHSELTQKEDVLHVRDLGSSNGTWVNKKRIQESELHAGDTLTVGPVIFTVVIDGEPATIKPVRTIVESKSKKTPKPKPSKKADETGSIDLDDSAELELLEDPEENPLAELEEISKKKSKS